MVHNYLDQVASDVSASVAQVILESPLAGVLLGAGLGMAGATFSHLLQVRSERNKQHALDKRHACAEFVAAIWRVDRFNARVETELKLQFEASGDAADKARIPLDLVRQATQFHLDLVLALANVEFVASRQVVNAVCAHEELSRENLQIDRTTAQTLPVGPPVEQFIASVRTDLHR